MRTIGLKEVATSSPSFLFDQSDFVQSIRVAAGLLCSGLVVTFSLDVFAAEMSHSIWILEPSVCDVVSQAEFGLEREGIGQLLVVPASVPIENELFGDDWQRVNETWTNALQVLSQWGEDPDLVLRKAAHSLNAWEDIQARGEEFAGLDVPDDDESSA